MARAVPWSPACRAASKRAKAEGRNCGRFLDGLREPPLRLRVVALQDGHPAQVVQGLVAEDAHVHAGKVAGRIGCENAKVMRFGVRVLPLFREEVGEMEVQFRVVGRDRQAFFQNVPAFFRSPQLPQGQGEQGIRFADVRVARMRRCRCSAAAS